MANVNVTQLIVKGLNLIVRGTVDGVECTATVPREGATDESVRQALLRAVGKAEVVLEVKLTPRQAERVLERVEEELAPEDIAAMKDLDLSGFTSTMPEEPKPEPTPEPETDDLEEKSKAALYGIAKAAGVQNAYKLSKEDLVEQIRKARRK